MLPLGNIIHNRQIRAQRGAALIIVMGICLSLVVVALYFSDSMLMEYRASDNSLEGREAAEAIEGARRYICNLLKNSESAGFMPDEESYEMEKVQVNNAAYWIIGRDADSISDARTVTFGLVSESSRININTAPLEMLEAIPGMTAEVAAAIVDWRDPDSEITASGAESNYYLALDSPYNCKNGPFESPEELRLVLGCTPDLLYGEDENQNGVLDPNEDDGDKTKPEDNADGILDAGILEYITVFSREPNQREDGSARINIRTQQRELRELLQQTFGQERAAQIISSIGPALPNLRSPLELCVRGKLTSEEFDRIDDALTVAEGQYIYGLVNVNTASAKALACIPGLNESLAEKLVYSRIDKSTNDLKCLAWVVGILDDNACFEAGPYLTTRTYQFRADIAAVGEKGRGYRRSLMIIDTVGGSSAVVYRRDMSRFGWALGSDVRKEYSGASNE